jgi:ribonuclease R
LLPILKEMGSPARRVSSRGAASLKVEMSIDSQKVIEIIKAADHPLGVKEVMGRLNLNPGLQTAMKRTLRDLVREGELLKEGKRFTVPAVDEPPRARSERSPTGERVQRPARPSLLYPDVEKKADKLHKGRAGKQVIVGTFHRHREGFGFVERYDGKGEDVFLPPQEAGQILDGDLVRVAVVPSPNGDKRGMGKVLEIVERRRQFALGVYSDRGPRPIIMPTDPALGSVINVKPLAGIRDGDIVRVKLTKAGSPGEAPEGTVQAKAGNAGDPKLEVLKAAYAQGFADEFPQSTLNEALRVARPVEPKDFEGRRDVRDIALVTIDGEDARDFDDAVFVERKGSDYRLVVAIADVSHYVEEGGAIDDEALRRTTSVYFPNAVLPMLPEALSNEMCSLKPDVERLCMVADMTFGPGGEAKGAEFYAGVMKSRARCTYTEVAAVLDGQSVPTRDFLKPQLDLSWELASKLNGLRGLRGSIDFDIPESRAVLDAQDHPTSIAKRERNNAHRLVEECMLAANEAVARFFSGRELPTMYRVHAPPDELKLEAVIKFAQANGFELDKANLTPQGLNDLLQKVAGKPIQRAINSLLLRSMMQAIYAAENIGHYGLGAEDYLHFTSPIRRYPDLVVHRLLRHQWAHPKRKPSDEEVLKLQAVAARCSERERAAMKAEREVDNFFACLFMKDKVGQRFAGVVANVTDFGIFVELSDVHVEGLLKNEELGSDVEFDAETLTVTIGNSGRVFTLGDKLEVELRSVNMERKQMDLSLVEEGKVVGGRTKGRTLDEAIAALRLQRGGSGKPVAGRAIGGKEARHGPRSGDRERDAARAGRAKTRSADKEKDRGGGGKDRTKPPRR